MKYQVIEDNGGGLHLYVFSRGKCVWAHTGYEYSPGNLVQDLDSLESGADPRNDWEVGVDDPQETYENTTGYEYGCEIVAEGRKGQRKLHKARMGRAAQIEFGVSDEERDASLAAAYLGRRGGSATSEAKTAAARENATRGGWPKGKPRKQQ